MRSEQNGWPTSPCAEMATMPWQEATTARLTIRSWILSRFRKAEDEKNKRERKTKEK